MKATNPAPGDSWTVVALRGYSIWATADRWALLYEGEQVYHGTGCCRLCNLQHGFGAFRLLLAREGQA